MNVQPINSLVRAYRKLCQEGEETQEGEGEILSGRKGKRTIDQSLRPLRPTFAFSPMLHLYVYAYLFENCLKTNLFSAFEKLAHFLTSTGIGTY